ncbi:MAG: hypothetical protein WBQ18_19515 [Solirubrobacteraceae bacterium]
MIARTPTRRQLGAVVYCPTCLHQFGGMAVCPWDNIALRPIEDAAATADPVAVAFYAALADVERIA